MDTPFRPCAGYLADTGSVKGLGVFAARDLETGEVVEIAPIVRIESALGDLPEALRHRVFDWARLAGESGVLAIALGYGCMYNHANPANLRYAACMDGAAISFVAVRAIACGEELTINYNGAGGEPESESDAWFRNFGIEPIDT